MYHSRSRSVTITPTPTPLGNGIASSDYLHATSHIANARPPTPRSPDPIEDLNVIIPLGGIGSRFQKEGYRFPKPLINIVGKPMICWLIERLSLRKNDTLWIAVNDSVEQEFQLTQLMRKWFPNLDVRLVYLHYLTKGATETLFIVSQSMPKDCLYKRTVSLDCDTIYFTDVLSRVRSLPIQHGACFYFPDTGSEPLFSYIQTDTLPNGRERIRDLQEKRAISRKANSGAYVFPSASALKKWACKLLDGKISGEDDKIGEYYTSQLIEMMIKKGDVPFLGLAISTDDFSCVGTPKQLRDFLKRLRSQDKGDIRFAIKKRRFCFDLDMTLVGVPLVKGDYSTCPPLWKNIELVRALHTAGHHVIIQTARRMRTHDGNVGAVLADVAMTTFDQLKRYEIPYHEVFFGKPYADVYVDDLAVHANLDTYQELGWIAEDDAADKGLADVTNAKKAGIVASRSFNHIQIVGQRVVKSSSANQILGEMFFYSHLPDAVAAHFPTVHEISYMAETQTYSITMQKLKGTTFSHMSVGRSLTAGRLRALLETVHGTHEASAECTKHLPIPDDLKRLIAKRSFGRDGKPITENSPELYDNYSRKLKARYAEYTAEYTALGAKTTSSLLNTLVTRLSAYESDKRATFAEVIHGDPVFSNAILNEEERRVYLLDVRSQLGSTLTTAGDKTYDLAKILQSLQGYDHVTLASDEELTHLLSADEDGSPETALDALVQKADRNMLHELREETFWPFVRENYPEVSRSDIVDIVGSLLFSLIPLHREVVRPIFLKMAQNVVEFGCGVPA